MNEPFRVPTEIPIDHHFQCTLVSLKRQKYFHPKERNYVRKEITHTHDEIDNVLTGRVNEFISGISITVKFHLVSFIDFNSLFATISFLNSLRILL